MGDIKIGRRLVLSYSLILLLMIVALVYSGNAMNQANKRSTEIFENNITKLGLISDMTDAVFTVSRVMRSVMLLQKTDAAAANKEKAKLYEARKQYDEAYDTLKTLPLDEKGKELVRQIDEHKLKARPLNDRVLALADQGKTEEGLELMMREARPVVQEWQDLLGEYSEHQKAKAAAAKAETAQQFKQAVYVTTALSIIVLALSALAAIFITRSITNPLNTLQKAINDVRQGGNLGALAQIDSKDEMSDMGFAVNQVLQDQVSAREKAEQDRIKADQDRQKAEAENEALNNSVIAILQAVNQLSQRDLTARAPVSQNIIGTVSDSINQLTEETSRVLHGVTQIATQVAEPCPTRCVRRANWCR